MVHTDISLSQRMQTIYKGDKSSGDLEDKSMHHLNTEAETECRAVFGASVVWLHKI